MRGPGRAVRRLAGAAARRPFGESRVSLPVAAPVACRAQSEPRAPARHPARRAVSWAAALVVAATAVAAHADSPPAASPAPPAETAAPADPLVAAEVARLVGQLDADDFELRRRAADDLRRHVAEARDPEAWSLALRATLLADASSLEVRTLLESLLRGLPERWPPVGNIDAAALARAAAELDANDWPARRLASDRLRWYLERPALAGPIMTVLAARLDGAPLSPEARRETQALYERARGVWLLGDTSGWQPPAADDAQLARWLDAVALGDGPADAPQAPAIARAAQAARRDLLNLLANDAEVPRVRQALEARLAEAGDAAARERLQDLLDWTRPAMVAEFWQSGQHRGIQHLLVDVPNFSEGARRPSHFDRIDDTTAHCISGHSLSAGDYPVGVLFPHPQQELAQFHLVNLPTPRRRMAYEYEVRRPDAARLADISRRTLRRLIDAGRPLDQRHLLMLRHLDARAVSEAAGDFFRRIDDVPTAEGPFYLAQAKPSPHNLLCYVLAQGGTREAAPALQAALREGRILPPTPEAPYRLPWIALLSIAARDPWPGCEVWLVEAVDNADPLDLTEPEGADVGGTAAGILLARHGQDPTRFELEFWQDDILTDLACPAARFVRPEGRQRFAAWWQSVDKQARAEPAPAAP